MRWRWCLIVGVGLFEATGLARAADENLAARVVLLANSDDPDSLRIARHYAEVRGVPAANIIALKLPLAETISWREFVATLWEPLLERLVREKWIDAIPMTTIDVVGRHKYAVHDTRIAALVTCRGVPLKIAHDPDLAAESLPFTSRREFRTNAGAVDSELSMLAFPNYPINAFVPNPLFQNEHPAPFEFVPIVKVSRLDGPTADDALALVDRAVEAERNGLLGRAYVDIARRDEVGDAWLEGVARQLAALDFDTDVDRAPATIPASARFDAPALYFGWYTGDLDGPMALPGFRFPPGAIALHIHSFSASTLRTSNRGWVGPLVARGVTATVGNVYEPYLEFTHRPDLLLRALTRGATFVDAAYFSLQVLSWQAIVIGDPLYRPFAVPLEEQLKNLPRLPPRLAAYAVLRRMHELDEAHETTEATALAISAQRQAPSLALGVALARRLRAGGDDAGAANALGFVPLLQSFRADEWALAREAVLLLEACGRPARAVDGWRALLAERNLPGELRRAWLREANKTALAANDFEQARAWEKEADALVTPAKE
ncbi:MAG TPA: TIGR03790 family protein [Opitutaceae bacterium]|nr:TIGR03790 family protein [Opitutaceae bacterium]